MPPETRTPSRSMTALDEHKEVLLPMPTQSVSQRRRRTIEKHLQAAWTAGWVADRNGVQTDGGKREYSDQVAPLLERDLADAEASAESPQRHAPLCGVCGLTAAPQDAHVGLTEHEFVPREPEAVPA